MLYEFARDYFPTASLNQTKALYNLNNRMYWMVMSRQKRLFGLEFGSKLLGYFTVVPLAREAIPLLEGDEFGVQHFNKDYVSKKGGNVAAVYIGSIAARRRVGPHAISRLAFIIGEYRNDGVPVYTRPVTKTGMRLMSEWGFAPVREPGRNHIYKLDEQSAALFEIERAKRALDRTIRVDDLGGNPSREEVQHLTGESDST
jgi:hypothetical protein